MIKIDENAFLSLIPPNLKEDIQIQCLSSAIDALFQSWIQQCQKVMIWCNSDNWNDTICDQLAVELRTPLYEQNMPLEIKKEMVKKTLDWFKRLGSAQVAKEVTATALQGTGLEEWFTANGRQPYTFRIKTKDFKLLENKDMILSKIAEVKNVRSSLEGFVFVVEGKIYTGSYSQTIEKIKIFPYQPKLLEQRNSTTIAVTVGCIERIKIKFRQEQEE